MIARAVLITKRLDFKRSEASAIPVLVGAPMAYSLAVGFISTAALVCAVGRTDLLSLGCHPRVAALRTHVMAAWTSCSIYAVRLSLRGRHLTARVAHARALLQAKVTQASASVMHEKDGSAPRVNASGSGGCCELDNPAQDPPPDGQVHTGLSHRASARSGPRKNAHCGDRQSASRSAWRRQNPLRRDKFSRGGCSEWLST